MKLFNVLLNYELPIDLSLVNAGLLVDLNLVGNLSIAWDPDGPTMLTLTYEDFKTCIINRHIDKAKIKEVLEEKYGTKIFGEYN